MIYNNLNKMSINDMDVVYDFSKKLLFWNVDTTYDFMRNDEDHKGTLYVQNAETIEPNLERLTRAAKKYSLEVVNTADEHTMEDAEISLTPNYVDTYPPHSLKGTKGAEYVPATKPENPYVIHHTDAGFDEWKVMTNKNILLYKNHRDAFLGSKHTEKVLELLNPDTVLIYGVATNECVDFVVDELVERKKNVYVVQDAIKELPNEIARIPLEKILDGWDKKGVKLISTTDVEKILAIRDAEAKEIQRIYYTANDNFVVD